MRIKYDKGAFLNLVGGIFNLEPRDNLVTRTGHVDGHGYCSVCREMHNQEGWKMRKYYQFGQ